MVAWSLLATKSAAALTEEQIIAQLIFKLTRAINSPSKDPLQDGDFFTIGVLGPNPFGSYLEEITTGKTAHEVPIRVRFCESLQEIRSCHMLYVSPQAPFETPYILRVIGDASVVTLGYGSDFARDGGIIAFTRLDNRIAYEINQKSAVRQKIVIHSYIKKNAVKRYH